VAYNLNKKMLDLILLYFLTKSIGVLAAKKGLPARKWKIITVVAWLTLELIGLIIGVTFFGTANLYSLLTFGLVCAFGGYLLVRNILEKKPDNKIDEDVDRIGVNDLSP
jgi:hypothetical protein